MRQLADTAGMVTLTQSYAPYGDTISSAGSGFSPYQFTGESRDVNGLTYLRARYYASSDGRFISRDTWAGDYNRPLSLNRWNYVEGNPVNFTDPLGLWSLASGLHLSNGGVYGQGQLKMRGFPCSGTCIGSANSTTTMPIFVPPQVGGVLYNDIVVAVPVLQFNSTAVKWGLYDYIMNDNCQKNSVLIAANTNSWKTIDGFAGTSYSFSQGGFHDFTIFMATGIGYDSGIIPLGMSIPDPASYYSVNLSIAYSLMRAQSQAEKDNFNMLNIWNKTNVDYSEARVGGVVFAASGLSGLQAYKSRAFTVTIQEHAIVQRFYRAIIETTTGFQEIKNRRKTFVTSFLSYQNNSWKETPFYSEREN